MLESIKNINWQNALIKYILPGIVTAAFVLLVIWLHDKYNKKSSNKVITADKPTPVAATASTPSRYHGSPRMAYSAAPESEDHYQNRRF